MARITGPSGGHGTLTGTAGNDLIIAFGDANTITGGGGNDTIQATSGNDNAISIGTKSDGLTTLTDLVRANGNGDTIFGGDENVRVVGNLSDSDVTLGYGNNTVSAFGSDNVLSFAGGSNNVKASGGNDTVTFSGFAGSFYTDTVAFSGSHNSLVNSLNAGPNDAMGALDVTGGSGNGTFLLGTTSGTIVTHGVDNYIQGGAFGTKIEAGSGYDTVSLIPGERGTGGDGNVLLSGTHNLVSGSVADVSVTGGMGYDTLDFGQGAGYATVHITDSGIHDSVSISGAFATIDGGGSYETISAVSCVATMTATGVADVLYLGGSENAAGPPSTYVNDLSSGLDILLDAKVSGDNYPSTGNLTINSFDAKGVIDFLDGRGSFTSVAQVVSDLHETQPGDYTLAFPDGTGTITFINDGHLTAANFKIG